MRSFSANYSFIGPTIIMLFGGLIAVHVSLHPKEDLGVLKRVLLASGIEQLEEAQNAQIREIFDVAEDQRATAREQGMNKAVASAINVRQDQERLKQLQKDRMRDLMQQMRDRAR